MEIQTDIKLNAAAQFPTQLRTVTKDDYSIRSLSLPPKYGVVSKVYVTQDASYSSKFFNKKIDTIQMLYRYMCYQK
jgi:hypothetical protein